MIDKETYLILKAVYFQPMPLEALQQVSSVVASGLIKCRSIASIGRDCYTITDVGISKLRKRDDDFLKALATDYAAKKVFTSEDIDIEDVGYLKMVFFPLQRGAWADSNDFDTALVYEYYDKRAGAVLQGKYPLFRSANRLNRADTDRLIDLVTKLER